MAAPATSPPPLPYRSALRCEQLVFTWARQTLTTVNGGMGVVGHSAGWPEEYLTGWFDYIPTDRLLELDRHAAPIGLARHVTPHGVLVVRKHPVPVRSHRRPGNYLVHAVLDRSGRLTPSDALALYDSPVLRKAWDESEPGLLPLLDVPTATTPPVPATPDLERLLPLLIEAVLAQRRAGGRVGLQAGDERRGVTWLTHLAAALPAGLAAGLTMSTYEPRPDTAGAAVTLLNEPFQDRPAAPASMVVLDRRSTRLPASRAEEREAAEQLARWHLEGAPRPEAVERAATGDELHAALRYHRIASTPVDQLDAAQLADLLRHDDGWVRRALPDALQRAVQEPLPAPVLLRLADELRGRDPAEREDLVEALLTAEAGTVVHTGRPGHARPVLDRLGVTSEQVAWRTVAYATERLQAGVLQAAELDRVLEAVARRAGQLSRRDRFRWLAVEGVAARLAGSTGWTDLAATMVEAYLTHPCPPDEHRIATGQLLARFERQVGKVVQCAADTAAPRLVVQRLLQASPCHGPSLLLRCDLPAAVVVEEVLPTMDDRDLLDVLHAEWPSLGAAVGLPPRVASLLRPVDGLPGESGAPRRRRFPMPRRSRR